MDNVKILKRAKQFYQAQKEVIIPTAVMVIICVAVTLALSATNSITAPKIDAIALQNQRDTMSKILPADSYEEAQLTLDNQQSLKYYTAVSDGKAAGYIFTISTKGYGGDVVVMTALATDGRVIAVDILDVSNETPGLGQNTKNKSFYSQFIDKTKDISLLKTGADGDKNEVNAVTGATVTSRAVTNAVNQALDYVNIIIENTEGGVQSE